MSEPGGPSRSGVGVHVPCGAASVAAWALPDVREGGPVSGWTDPSSSDPIGDLQRALDLVETARRTVMCSPENEERIRAARPRPFVITDVSS